MVRLQPSIRFPQVLGEDGKNQDEGASPPSDFPCDPPSALAVEAGAAEVWGGEVASLDSAFSRLARALVSMLA